MKPVDHWSIKLLRLFCPSHLLEEIEGDLVQRYERDILAAGKGRANRRLAWNVIRYFRLEILLRNKIRNTSWLTNIHYVRFAWRNALRHPVFSSINILGLTIGISVYLILSNYVLYEKSYDTHFENRDNIYRLIYSRLIDGKFQYSKAQVFPAVGETLKMEIPEVRRYTRMFPLATYNEPIFTVNEKTFSEIKIFAVDSTFLQLFPIKILIGNPKTALSGKDKMIISKSTAKTYFGERDPLNQFIHWKGVGDFIVSGVFEDLPENSHMQFNILTSWMQIYREQSAWIWDGFYTYVDINPDANLHETKKLIQQILDEKLKGVPNGDRTKSEFKLQPVSDIHLKSNHEGEMTVNGDYATVRAMQLVAIIVLVLAIINYINLTLARAIKRSKEVAVRKLIGSTTGQVARLFMIESLIYNLAAVFIAIFIFIATRQNINLLVGKNLPLVLFEDPLHLVLYVGPVVILIALLSSYPVTKVLSSITLVDSAKGKVPIFSSMNRFRKVLLTFQFGVTIALTIATFVIQNQVSFMQQQRLGFDDQNLIVRTYSHFGAEMDSSFTSRMEAFKTRIKDLAGVRNSTVTSNIPGRENEWIGRLRKPSQSDEVITTTRTRVDPDFIKTYDLSLTAGRNFEGEKPDQLILNQTAIKMLGFKTDEEAIGQKLGDYFEIIGVVNDYHEQSVQRLVRPAMFTCGQGYMKFVTIKIESDDIPSTMADIEKIWKEVYGDKPFEHFFLSDFFAKQYADEQRLEKVFAYFSSVSIIVACLGLFGFTYYTTNQRIKEIGIRKILGATGSSLVKLLTSEYFTVLVVAAIIAIPLSFIFCEEWLSGYPVRIDLITSYFILPVLLTGLLLLFSIVVLLLKAIHQNPSESLKHE